MIDMTGWTVLIVDDEPDNVGVAKMVLEFHGAKTLIAENGQQGLDLLERETPALVLLDLSMPVLNGWELVKQIRAMPRLKDLTVIAVTAHAMKGDREKVLEAGFDSYIAKPFRVDSFLDEIAKCLTETGKLNSLTSTEHPSN